MYLILTPQIGLPDQTETTLHIAGDAITVDGVVYDLSAVPEGGKGHPEPETPFSGPVTRVEGTIRATVRVVLDNTAMPNQPDSPWVIPTASGHIVVPAARKPAAEVQS
jgi:hypothetical protein